MPWTDKQKTGVSEVDFLFTDGSDFLFTDGTDFVFRDATIAGTWVDKSKV